MAEEEVESIPIDEVDGVPLNKNKEVILAEYEALRDEILHNDRLIVEVFTFSVIASGALIGYATSLFGSATSNSLEYRAYFSLAPLIIIIPCSYLLVSLRIQIIRLGSYIRAFIESKLIDLQYEGAVIKLAEKEKSSWLMRLSLTPISLAYTAIFIICWLTVFFLYSPNMSIQICLNSMIPIVLLICSLLLFVPAQFLFIKAGNRKEKFYNYWQDVKKDLSKKTVE